MKLIDFPLYSDMLCRSNSIHVETTCEHLRNIEYIVSIVVIVERENKIVSESSTHSSAILKKVLSKILWIFI